MMKNNINTESEYISDFLFNHNNSDLSIYIHIPFCEQRCYYCDFCSSTKFNEIERYFEYLNKEIALYGDFLKNKLIKSIFIGGGTPSSVNSKYIKNVLENIYKYVNLDENCEITIEMNPNSISESKVKDYISSNINRFSMGVQSFNDTLLQKIGRIHTKAQALKSYDLLRNMNCSNINLDLMLALPNQTINDIEESIKYIELLKPEHISYYSLILEEGTELFNQHKKNNFSFPDEVTDRKMYKLVVESLKNLGINQYEISNFSKDNFESVHNMRYWTLKDYIGLGLNSSSNISNLRFKNTDKFEKYYELINKNLLPIEEYENLSLKDRVNEYIMMGLRLNNGINIKELEEKFKINFTSSYKNVIFKNTNLELINFKNDILTLTEKGRDLSNQVELDFFQL